MTLEIFIKENLSLLNPPQELLNEVIASNTFRNPLFESNEQAGRSNWKTEAIITTYRHEGERLILPRGYMRDLLKVSKDLEIPYSIIDERICQSCIYPEALNGIVLRPYQKRAVDEAMRFDQGVIVSPTGSGKSLIGLEIIRRRGQKALILVHRGELAKQWINVIRDRMGLEASLVGDGKWNIGNEITVAMVQTLSAKENEAKTLYNEFGAILIDECHHIPAQTFFDVISHFSAKFRYGLSATIERRDGLEKMIFLAVGPIVNVVLRQEVENMGSTVPVEVFPVKTAFNPGPVYSWSEYIDSLTANAPRNELIIDLAKNSNGATLILTDRISHAQQLSEMLERRHIDHVLAHGKINKKDREDVMERIKSSTLTVGTCSLLGEGLDVSVWSNLIMGAPISSEIKLLQAIGRVVRPSFGKEKALVWDLKDDCGFAGASFNKRFAIYKKNKIWVNFKQMSSD